MFHRPLRAHIMSIMSSRCWSADYNKGEEDDRLLLLRYYYYYDEMKHNNYYSLAIEMLMNNK